MRQLFSMVPYLFARKVTAENSMLQETGHALRCGAIVKKIGPLHWRTLSTLLSNLERISLFSNGLTSVNNSFKPDIEVFSGCSWLISP